MNPVGQPERATQNRIHLINWQEPAKNDFAIAGVGAMVSRYLTNKHRIL